ncbi:MAG: hypothetical protein ABW208_07170 [Pyrinomonadaceae bacterium]
MSTDPRAPLVERIQETVPGEATAGSDKSVAVGRASFGATVESVTYAPNALITGANTNTRRVALINRGQSGSGSTVVAELQFNSGVNGPAFDEKSLTLSATPANLKLAEGDILEWLSDAVGTGLADPGGLVVVKMSRS